MWHRQSAVCLNQRGLAMVLALMVLGVSTVLAFSLTSMVGTDIILRVGSARMRDGFYAAEAGLNIGMAEFVNIFKDYNVPTAGNGDFAPREATIGTRTVHYQLAPVEGYDPCTEGEDAECYATIPAGEKFAGLQSIPYRYTVKATSENTEGDQEVDLGAQFDIHNIPIFQFLAFYAGDLEINPGPPMDLHGRVHTNSNLYLSAGDRLTISDSPLVPHVQVSAQGSIFHDRKDANGCASGRVTIDRLLDANHDDSYDPRDLPSCQSTPLSRATLDGYLGSVLATSSEIEVPPIDDFQRSADAPFWQHADLRIVLRLDLPRTQIDFGAADLCPGGPGLLISPKLYPIEIQNIDGSQDTLKTRRLWRFLCEQRGALFYNDVPKNPATVNTVFPAQAGNYLPPFGDRNGNDVLEATELVVTNLNNQVYRRVGVDTGGDGIIDRNGDGTVSNSDKNLDICPYGSAVRPFWMPDYCLSLLWPGSGLPQPGFWFYNTDYRRGGFYNRREQRWVYMLNVNLRALIEWNEVNGSPLFPYTDSTHGGLVLFLSVQGPYATTSPDSAPVRYGIRVFDSADLDTRNITFPSNAEDPTGVTVVSDQAVYVQGNYNHRDKYPAAVIGDTLNVLSQAWEVKANTNSATPANDLKSAADLSTGFRDVFGNDGYNAQNNGCGTGTCRSFSSSSALGINAAFVAGVDVTPFKGPYSEYNGGLENYPRFHENWGGSSSGKILNYRGSYVSLGTPQRAKGRWCGTGSGCNIYDPPQRPWDFDANFMDVRNLPPHTPKVSYVQQRIYTRFYK